MPARKPHNESLTFIRKVMAIKKAGLISGTKAPEEALSGMLPLNERIPAILGLLQTPKKPTDMVYFIMYDIEDDRVRRQVSRYLEKKGFLRIQRSIFLAKGERAGYNEICQTLKEVNEVYENFDSIIIIPVSSDEMRSMKLIGKNVDIQAYHDKPNSMVF
jgi:CRISPR-associated protein Cas2